MGAETDTPGSSFRKLSVEMEALGFDTREKFDDIAAEAAKADKQTLGRII